MHYGNPDLLHLLESGVQKSFFKQLLMALKASHQQACSHMEANFSQPVAKDLLPHYCRAILEDKLKDLCERHNVAVRSVLNQGRNAAHTEIEMEIDSKQIVLTALAVNNCCFDLKRVQAAQFRKSLAEIPWLFEELSNQGTGYYGLIMHGVDREDSDKLSFAYLAFPTADCYGWFGQYSLFDLAGEAVEVEIIEDKVDPKLRLDILLEKEEAE